MGVLDALRGLPGRAAGEDASVPANDAAASLQRRRDELVAQVAELHWDLGGLAYEMAIRDHFRLDVLVRKAAELQERDAELGELERVLSLQENAGAGTCPGCGALRSRGAVFCWQCGKVLMERAPSVAANGTATVPGDGGAPGSGVPAGDSGLPDAPTVALPPGPPAS